MIERLTKPLLLAVLGAAVASVALEVSRAVAEPPVQQGSATFVTTAATFGDRLRVAAGPGDFGLRNAAVTAVVRKQDGWLVDFWPNRPVRPTTGQLGRVTNADGIWQLAPAIHDGKQPLEISYGLVTRHPDRVTAAGNLAIAGGSLGLETHYRLSPDKATVLIETTLLLHAPARLWMRFQDHVKWGNTDYFVEGEPGPLNDFDGKARWVGRHGLNGDMKLTVVGDRPMELSFKQTYPGLAPAITADYGLVELFAGKPYVVKRRLSYEPLPTAGPEPAPPLGRLVVDVVDERGRPLPSKLSLTGRGKTPTPDFGNDGSALGSKRFAASGTGHFELKLPPGEYSVLATSGIERDAKRWPVTIEREGTVELSGALPRIIETPGWISADLHLHQVSSVDADLAHEARIVSVAAEGLELAAATDHYAVTDLAPAVAELVNSGRLARHLATMIGSEVSTTGRRFGHFNLFPMLLGDEVEYHDTTPKALFADMRAVAPEGVIQVNHPRWKGIGYFYEQGLDPKTHRIPANRLDEYSSDFDAIEIFNGLDAYSEPKIRQVMRDWLALLGRGHRYTATGNSDSHKLAFQDPGLPRNLIKYGPPVDDDLDVHAGERAIVEGIKRGRVLVTSGPIIDVNARGAGPGDTVKSGGKPVTIEVTVRAAPWIDVQRVEVLVGPKANAIRYVPVRRSKALVRYHERIRVPGYQKTFVIVLARGKLPLPNVYATGVKPFAFTNPIWIEP